MASKKIQVRVKAKPRNLLSFLEKGDDVYVRVYSGASYGLEAGGEEVKEARFSLHPSPRSEKFITIKHTRTLAGQSLTSVAITDAAKSEGKFFHIVSNVFTSLKSKNHDVKKFDSGLYVGELNPRKSSLYISAFVGHPESNFDLEQQGLRIDKLNFNKFQVVVLTSYLDVPASPMGMTAAAVTFRPEIYPDEAGQDSAREKMTGYSPAQCLGMHKDLQSQLMTPLLERYIRAASDEATRKRYLAILESFPPIASIDF
ncbi:hypothetical protein [uncultured Xanthomonas sp.]|uniref:hypothetical protein n=1 Tax=uncultured Xanthomonas sp. TaxID=152831 RepID=UPI0037491102